jgi:hypothetical protein
MFLFWISIILAIVIGGFTLFQITVGLGLQLIALILAGNAYVRLQRGNPVKTPIKMQATWAALAVSAIGFALGIFRAAA